METNLRRIHIIGGPGSGKSTLARKLGAALDLPVFDLDRIAFEGQDFDERPLGVRLAEVHEIARQPSWITEGIFLGWVDELLENADVILWLDNLPWHKAAWRIIHRFARYGWLELRRQQGPNKFLRIRDYRRNLAQLIAVMFMSRGYYHSSTVPIATNARQVTRAATAAELARYQAKVLHSRTDSELSAVVAQLRGERGPDPRRLTGQVFVKQPKESNA